MAPDDAGSRLEAALDELYGTEPGEFVATRKRLASELRAAGDPSAAKVLGAARRPTKAAWALNVLARRSPELITELLERSDELRAAQAQALSGGRGSQREATRAQRRALAEAADGAVAPLGGAGDTARAEVLSMLHAAAADERVGALLRAGRLVRGEGGATGFPDGFGVDGPPPVDELAERRSRRVGSPSRVHPPNDDELARQPKPRERVQVDERDRTRGEAQERERARQREEARRRAAAELARAEAALRAASSEAEAAGAEIVEAEARVAARRADLDAARVVLRAAKDRVAATDREVARLAKEVTRRSATAGPSGR